MLFHPHKFHPTRYAEDPYDLLIEYNPLSPSKKGPCKSHKRNFGTELIVERQYALATGYVCEDCRRLRRKLREYNYYRGGGIPLRVKRA